MLPPAWAAPIQLCDRGLLNSSFGRLVSNLFRFVQPFADQLLCPVAFAMSSVLLRTDLALQTTPCELGSVSVCLSSRGIVCFGVKRATFVVRSIVMSAFGPAGVFRFN